MSGKSPSHLNTKPIPATDKTSKKDGTFLRNLSQCKYECILSEDKLD